MSQCLASDALPDFDFCRFCGKYFDCEMRKMVDDGSYAGDQLELGDLIGQQYFDPEE